MVNKLVSEFKRLLEQKKQLQPDIIFSRAFKLQNKKLTDLQYKKLENSISYYCQYEPENFLSIQSVNLLYQKYKKALELMGESIEINDFIKKIESMFENFTIPETQKKVRVSKAKELENLRNQLILELQEKENEFQEKEKAFTEKESKYTTEIQEFHKIIDELKQPKQKKEKAGQKKFNVLDALKIVVTVIKNIPTRIKKSSSYLNSCFLSGQEKTNTLKIMVTDLNTVLIFNVEGSFVIENSFEGCFNAVQLKDAFNINDSIFISSKDNILTFKYFRSKDELNLSGINDKNYYPPEPFIEDKKKQSGILNLKSYSRVINYSSSDEVRTTLNGILIDGFNYVSTDGHRLAMDINEKKSIENTILPNIKIIPALSEFFSEMKIEEYENICILKNDTCKLIFKPVEGTYPTYKNLIPKEFKYSFRIKTDEFIKPLKFMLPFTNENTKMIKFDFSGNKISIIGENKNTGSTTKKDIINNDWDFEPISLHINASFLLEILNEHDTYTMKFSTELSPIIYEDKNIFRLQMPLRHS